MLAAIRDEFFQCRTGDFDGAAGIKLLAAVNLPFAKLHRDLARAIGVKQIAPDQMHHAGLIAHAIPQWGVVGLVIVIGAQVYSAVALCGSCLLYTSRCV